MENSLHWRYFLAIDDDLLNLARYIEFDQKNFNTYSIELVRLYLSICSEIDMLMKVLCKKTNPVQYTAELKKGKGKGERRPNMDIYKKIITGKYPLFYKIEISLPQYKIVRTPWEDFGSQANPEWWSQHNDVKHERNENYEKANLINVIDSAAALLIVIIYVTACGKKGVPIDDITLPKLFGIPENCQAGGVKWAGNMLYLPDQLKTRREKTRT